MMILEVGRVEIDHCTECGGVWLDAGELEMLSEQSGIVAGRADRALADAVDRGPSARLCPRCRAAMNHAAVGRVASGLERCPRGPGVWLDGGELEAVLRDLPEGASAAVARTLSELFHDRIAWTRGRQRRPREE